MNRIPVVKIQMVKERNLMVEKKRITSPKDAYEIANKYLHDVDREHLVIMALNTKNEVIALNTVSIGSLNSSIVHPREVFKALILCNAASFIISHNHPSGDPSPSKEDLSITSRLKECGGMMGIELLDHVVLGNERYVSFKEKGIL